LKKKIELKNAMKQMAFQIFFNCSLGIKNKILNILNKILSNDKLFSKFEK
jgi:hypothetical protein